MELGLRGRTALVTGASQGIGRATAIGLAREGANVAMVARTEADLEEAAAEVRGASAAVQVLPVPADVRLPDDLLRVHTEVRARLGPVDVLVNNAGTSQGGPFLEQSDDDWQDDLDLKVVAAIRLARLVIPDMQERGGGRIVNVTALVGKHPGAATAPTSVSRAAGIALTKVLSKEFGPDGILVNTVCIGTIESGQHDRRWQRDAPELPREEYYAQRAQERSIPLGRVGRAEEAANLIVFLASEAASFISGTAINIDGGQSHVV
jgi:3-oxoacyl-[acyl-carrier protein] reductase